MVDQVASVELTSHGEIAQRILAQETFSPPSLNQELTGHRRLQARAKKVLRLFKRIAKQTSPSTESIGRHVSSAFSGGVAKKTRREELGRRFPPPPNRVPTRGSPDHP